MGLARDRGCTAAASTVGFDSTKNPDYTDTLYVTELVAPDTVNTMPERTLEATADHGVIAGDTIRPNYADAEATLDAISAAGADLDDISRVLEEEGVEKFNTAWDDLLTSVAAKLESAK
jgi:transaldolase